MPHLTPIPQKKWLQFLKFIGCHFKRRGKGDHVVWMREDLKRPIIFQDDREISISIIRSNLKTLGLSADQYLEILNGL